MKELSVNELKEWLGNLFEKVKVRDYENSAIKAASRCFYEYESIMNDGLTEKIVCALIIGKLIASSNNGIYIGQHNLVKDAIEKTLSSCNELDLTTEEKKEIFSLAQELSELLPHLKIEHNSNVG